MSKVSLVINGQKLTAAAEGTILEAAEEAGIRIPTLCYLKEQEAIANCRICLVEVEGSRTLMPACATKVREGMVVQTDTKQVRESRRLSLELILANHSWDCHHCLRIGNYQVDDLSEELCSFCYFCDCVRDGDCELQALAEEYNVNQLPFAWNQDPYEKDLSTGVLARNPNKCIKCRRCIGACSEQGIHALTLEKRGVELMVSPALGKPLAESPCVLCGKCLEACPTGAIYIQEQLEEMLCQVRLNPQQVSVVQVSDRITGELARLLKLDEAQLDLHKLAAGLRKIGFSHVVQEEPSEAQAQAAVRRQVEERLASAAGKPLIVSRNWPAIQLLKQEFPQLAGSLLVCPTAEQQFAAAVKGEWAESQGLSGADICTIALSTGCGAKAEAKEADSLVDFVLTPREIQRLLNKTAVDVTRQKPGAFDDLTGEKPVLDEQWIAWLSDGEEKTGITTHYLAKEGERVAAAAAFDLKAVRQLLAEAAAGISPYQVIRI